jgi:protein O-mannosyl-transferase
MVEFPRDSDWEMPALITAGTAFKTGSGRWAAIISALAGVALYAVTLRGTYIYDDVAIVHEDPRVLQPAQFYKLWTQPFFASSVDKLYRPLVSSSFAIENYLHGDRPWMFHGVNILLHALTCALVALFAARLAGSVAAWVAGILFAVHPLHVEAVAGLVGRAESACAVFLLGGLLVFLRSGNLSRVRVGMILLCFLGAVFSKEQGVLFPLLLVFAYPLRAKTPTLTLPPSTWGGKKPGEDLDERKQLKVLGAALCLICAGYFILRERVASFSWDRNRLDWYVNPMILSAGRDRLLMPLALLGRYTRLLVFPTSLSIDYGGGVIGSVARLNDPYLYIGAAALLAWIAMFIVAWRRRRFDVVFCLLSLGVCYGMIGNVISLIGTIFGDRLMYLPSIFFMILTGIGAAALPRALVIPLTLVIAVAASVRTFTYARLWNDPGALYSYTLVNHPNSERGAALLADFYLRHGEFDRSLQVSRAIQAYWPDRWQTYAMQMRALVGEGQYDGAIAVADVGLAHVPKDSKLILIQNRELIQKQRDAAETGRKQPG